MNERELRDSAASARENLADLIADPAVRAETDRRLADALAAAPGEAAIPLRQALRSNEATARFLLRRATEAELKDHQTGQTRGIFPDRVVGPLGNPSLPIGILFMCPNCDHSEVLETVTDNAPTCPVCGSSLIRMDG